MHFWRGQQKRGTRREEEEEEEEDCGWVSLAPDYCPASYSEYESWTHALSANEIGYPIYKNVGQETLPEMDRGRSTERRRRLEATDKMMVARWDFPRDYASKDCTRRFK